jgi:hypothetical protein
MSKVQPSWEEVSLVGFPKRWQRLGARHPGLWETESVNVKRFYYYGAGIMLPPIRKSGGMLGL